MQGRPNIRGIQYANHVVACAYSVELLTFVIVITALAEPYETVGLTISIGETMVIHQHKFDTHCVPLTVHIHLKLLENVDYFPYFGCHLSIKGNQEI